MTTGDLRNNMRKLTSELKQVKYDLDKLDIEGLSKGMSSAFLPIYHYIFIDYSKSLAESVATYSLGMRGKTDLRFIELMYKLLRDMYSYKPPITKEQFFSTGFIERKVIMCTDIITLVKPKRIPSAKRREKTATTQKGGPLVSQIQNVEVKNQNPKVGKPQLKAIEPKLMQLSIKENTVPVRQPKTQERPRTAATSQPFRHEHVPAVRDLYPKNQRPATTARKTKSQVRTVERHVHTIPSKCSQGDTKQIEFLQKTEKTMKSLMAMTEELKSQSRAVTEATNRIIATYPTNEYTDATDFGSSNLPALNGFVQDTKEPLEEVILVACPKESKKSTNTKKTFTLEPFTQLQSDHITTRQVDDEAFPEKTFSMLQQDISKDSPPTSTVKIAWDQPQNEASSPENQLESDTVTTPMMGNRMQESEPTTSSPPKSKPTLFSPITPVHELNQGKTNLQDDDELLFSSEPGLCVETSKVSTPSDPSKDISNIVELEFVNSPLKAKANRIADMMLQTQSMLKMKPESQQRVDEVP